MAEYKSARAELHRAARTNFYVFAQLMFGSFEPGKKFETNWHIEAICHHLQQSYEGALPRLIICLPPRSLKTYLISIAFPAWVIGKDASTKFICASYNQKLAENFSNGTRSLMRSERYRTIFPEVAIDPTKASASEVVTKARGGRFATSVGGTLTGRGADYLIIDDPLKAEDAESETARHASVDWFRRSAMSRLNDPKSGKIIVVAQRLHEDDLPGTLIEDGGWHLLELPMVEWKDRTVITGPGLVEERKAGELLQPDRIEHEQIAKLERSLGTRVFEAQYNQRPLPPGGAIFQDKWFKYYDERPPLRTFEWVVQSWDTAQGTTDSHDYSAVTTWGFRDGKYWLLNAARNRLAFNNLEKIVKRHRKGWDADLAIVEKQGAGFSLWQNITGGDQNHWLKTLSAKKSKEEYALQQTPKFERGEILLPRQDKWLDMYKKEILGFPHGKHDDLVDATTLFLRAVDLGNLPAAIDLARSYGAYD